MSTLLTNLKWIVNMNFNTRPGRQIFYKSKEWIALRNFIRLRDPVCVSCKADGTYAIDHIVSIVDAPHLCLNPLNCQGLCLSRHSKKTVKEQSDKFKKGKIYNLKWI